MKKVIKLISRANIIEKEGHIFKALKLYKRASRMINRLERRRVNKIIGSELDFINQKYPIDDTTKNLSPEEWCKIWEADKELEAHNEKLRNLHKAYLKENRFYYFLCHKIKIIYTKIGNKNKARYCEEECKIFHPTKFSSFMKSFEIEVKIQQRLNI